MAEKLASSISFEFSSSSLHLRVRTRDRRACQAWLSTLTDKIWSNLEFPMIEGKGKVSMLIPGVAIKVGVLIPVSGVRQP